MGRETAEGPRSWAPRNASHANGACRGSRDLLYNSSPVAPLSDVLAMAGGQSSRDLWRLPCEPRGAEKRDGISVGVYTYGARGRESAKSSKDQAMCFGADCASPSEPAARADTCRPSRQVCGASGPATRWLGAAECHEARLTPPQTSRGTGNLSRSSDRQERRVAGAKQRGQAPG